jgi:hypothetical protein
MDRFFLPLFGAKRNTRFPETGKPVEVKRTVPELGCRASRRDEVRCFGADENNTFFTYDCINLVLMFSSCGFILRRRSPLCSSYKRVLVCGRSNIPHCSRRRASSSTSTGNSKNDISYSPPSYPSPDSGPSSPSIGPPSDEDDKAFVMRRLYEIAKPERTLILASACTLAVTSSITLLLPYACGNVLDAAVAGGIGDGGRYSPLAISMGLFGLTGMAGLGVYARSEKTSRSWAAADPANRPSRCY